MELTQNMRRGSSEKTDLYIHLFILKNTFMQIHPGNNIFFKLRPDYSLSLVTPTNLSFLPSPPHLPPVL